MGVTTYASSTQNDEYEVSLQHLKKEWSYEVHALHAGKHGSLLQVDRDLTALTSLNATLTSYYASNVLPPLVLFVS